MLGNSTLQNWYAQQDSIQVAPKVIAEWNANALAQPYVYGDGTGSFTEISAISGLTASTGTLGGNSKKFTITIPYVTTAVATEYSFTHTITTAVAGKSYKLSMFAQSDKVIDVLVIATAKDAAGSILSQSSTNISVGPAKLSPFLIECNQFNDTDLIKTMEYTISAINEVYPSQSVSLTIDSLRVYEIDQYEVLVNQYFSLKEVFSINRPGDSYLAGSTNAGNGNVSPYNVAWQDVLKKAAGADTWNSIRNFLPAFNSHFKYYMYNGITVNEIFAKYSTKAVVNKIVLKVNSKQTIPSSIKIYTLTTKDGTFSGTPDQTISAPFDVNGLAEIFWDGAAWTKTAWTTTPTYIDQTISLSKAIYGIKIEFTSTTGEVHLIEVSPRLELNLSSYISDFSVTNELSNDSLPTPVGVANSDTATVKFENLPVYNGSAYIQPFDNYTGPLAGMLKKNVIFKILVSTNVNGTWTDQQIAKMITSSWANNGIDSCSVELFDGIKSLSQIQSPALYRSSANVGTMISILLDSVGFTDYNYDELMTISSTYLQNSTIENYWTITQGNQSVLESLQQLLLPYQISMYMNEYGVIKFKHIKQVIESTPESLYKITSQESGGIKPNIIDFTINDENAPSKASVEYANIYPSTFTDIHSGLRTAGRETMDNVFERSVLGYLRLSQPLAANERSMSVYIDTTSVASSYIDSHSGYLLVDSEIIKFDGIEYTFNVIYKTNAQPVPVKRVLKNKSEIDSVKAEFLSSQDVFAVSEQPQMNNIKVLRNLTRGCFGTKVEAHTLGSILADFSSTTAGSFSSNNEYINLNKVASVVSHVTPCTADTRIFSASFVISESVSLPTDGTLVEYGLQIGAASGNVNAIRVGVQLFNKDTGNNTKKYTYYLVVRQYDGSGNILSNLSKKYELESYEVSKAGEIKKQNYIFNVNGENSIVAAFIPGSQNNLNKMMIMINGNVIKISDSKDKITLATMNSLSFTTNEFSAFTLNSAPSFAGKKLSVYTNGAIPIKLAQLQGFEVLAPSDKNTTMNLLNILSTIMYGNLLGLSNKDEIESVLTKRKVSELATKIGYMAKSVAREIKEVNADFTQSKFPVLYSYIVRNNYTEEISVKQGTDTLIKTKVIPSDSITFSRIDHTPTSARFVMINSYSAPVYINASSYGAYSLADNITQMFSAILVKNSTSKLTADINDDNSNTEISISSDWIQNESSAQRILSDIVSAAIMKNNSINVSVFGNPLIMVGDVLNVEHHLKNFTGKYVVVSVSKEFNNGINTSLSLRRIAA